MIQVEVPTVGESISEVQIGQWLKAEGDFVESGEDLVEIETEKASVQIPAPASGILQGIQKQQEEFALVGEVIAQIDPNGAPSGGGSTNEQSAAPATSSASPSAPAPAAPASNTPSPAKVGGSHSGGGGIVMPAARRILDEHGINAQDVPATGPGGRLLKEDVVAFIRNPPQKQAPPPAPAPPQPAATAIAAPAPPAPGGGSFGSLMTEQAPHRGEEVKPMSMLRRTIASRLVEAQQTAALLTTFNEIDMQPTMEMRSQYKDLFAEKHGVKLGFMSFFAKAAVEALRKFPAVNAEIRDGNIVYRHYQDIGIAIGGGKGLVVPILRNVERMNFADIERSISDYAKEAGENRLQPEDLMGGTFTISNGGIYGSLLSTPIVNPPQSGILGLHSIQKRPIAVNDEVVIRPMMYIALTYDHRIVDGREAVGFLKTIKDVIEEPARLFLEL
ncbi:Dihydrolipoyllysine-residue succinyltransferase component of 2-oxoglutarate dehydrogenase complex [Rubripirellula obstinata]|uniref:Dihydrolipoyllysine-residue succinyltransferase component of 2-oxoglutarate dehydrogenase complex n=2 Tax=Rubripirellula obstinata TaxID=406547 RepID=A0A5B1CQN6_9BACT|nr:Dihydrolipoyllysine-residue succinyltransferase component of 2-oxoglutarate dehydrogenase complex [Rubripirellula obstinata]